MTEEKTEGIVLRCMPFKENARILTLITLHSGLINIIVKKISRRTPHLLSLTTPFSQGEFFYTKRNSDLFQFQEGSLIEEHLFLRNKLSFLKTAGQMAQALLQGQLPGKPAPLLYALFSSYLKQIPSFDDPEILLGSFYLKILKYEGLIADTQPFPTFSSFEWE